LGIVRRESIRNTILYYSGVILGYFNMVVFLPKILQADQYGLIRFLFTFSSVLTFFYLLGIPNVIIRFFPYLKNEEKRHNGILFFAFTISGISIVFFTILFFILKPIIFREYAEKAALFIHYYYVLFPLAIGFAIFEVLNAYCKSLYKTNFAVFVNEIYVRIIVAGLGVLFLLHYISFKGFLYLFVAGYFSNALILMFYTWRSGILYLQKPSKEVFKPTLIKQMVNYGLFNFFGGATGMLIDKIDVLFIGSYLGLKETGIYSIAFLMAATIALPAKALWQVLFPLTAEAYQKNDREKLGFLYTSSCNNQLFIGSVVFMIAWVNFDSFFSIVHPAFIAAKTAFLILSIGRLFDMATGINGLLVVNSKYYRTDLLFTSVLIIITIISNQLLIPQFGLRGAATATAGSIILYNIVKYIFVWSKLKLQPFNPETFRISFAILVIFIITLILPDSGNAYFNIIYKTIAIGLAYIFAMLFLRINPELLSILVSGFEKGKKVLPFKRKRN
jgi:O-antigen/teichoic acid export membrane protein